MDSADDECQYLFYSCDGDRIQLLLQASNSFFFQTSNVTQ